MANLYLISGLAFTNMAVVIGLMAWTSLKKGPRAAATDFVEYFGGFIG